MTVHLASAPASAPVGSQTQAPVRFVTGTHRQHAAGTDTGTRHCNRHNQFQTPILTPQFLVIGVPSPGNGPVDEGHSVLESMLLQAAVAGHGTIEKSVRAQHDDVTDEDYLVLRLCDVVFTAQAMTLLRHALDHSATASRRSAAQAMGAALSEFVATWNPTLQEYGIDVQDIHHGTVALQPNATVCDEDISLSAFQLAFAAMGFEGDVAPPGVEKTLRIFKMASQICSCIVPQNNMPALAGAVQALQQAREAGAGNSRQVLTKVVVNLLQDPKNPGGETRDALLRAVKRQKVNQ